MARSPVPLLCIALTLPTAGWSATLRVPDTYFTIQSAILSSSPGDTIEVAPGAYSGPITIPWDLSLESDDGSGSTVISGFGSDVIDVQNGASLSINGFTLESGQRGIRVHGGGALDATDLVIEQHSTNDDSGGGIYASNATINVQDSTFSYNSSQEDGGAIGLHDSSATIARSLFDSNDSTYGGAIGLAASQSGGSLTITECTFLQNDADDDGGAVAAYTDGPSISIQVVDSVFAGNEAMADGGAIDAEADSGALSISITGTEFTGNFSGDEGGAVDIDGYNNVSTVEGNLFIMNQAAYGGAVYIYGGDSADVRSNLFCENYANEGGALATDSPGADIAISFNVFTQNYSEDYAGAVEFYNSEGALINNTLVGNHGHSGTALYVYNSDLQVSNNLFAWNEHAEALEISSSTVLLEYNAWFQNDDEDIDQSDVDYGTGAIIDSAPQLAGYSGLIQQGNPVPCDWLSYDLSPSSPLIDAGNPAASYNDPNGSRNDIGALGGHGGNSGDVDTDGDGWSDAEEEQAGSNPNASDSDNDGLPDSIELDDPANPQDTDGDGLPDVIDRDDDGDGLPTSEEGQDDPDGDGLPNYLDPDSDNDGLPDGQEGTDDLDGDGLPNYVDTDSDDDGIADADEQAFDADCDGIPDFLDADNDGECQAFLKPRGCQSAVLPQGGWLLLLGMALLHARRRLTIHL